MCIYHLNMNYYLIPCDNGRHLEHCKTFTCDSMLKCTNVYCIPWSYVCNGRWDCPLGDDETKCNKSTTCKNMFHCRNTKHMCLHLGNTCDGHDDCPLSDDEMLCELKLVYCPSYCNCLLYAIHCRGLSGETFKMIFRFSYFFAQLSKFKLIFIHTLINLLKDAVVINLPENEISYICDTFSKFSEWKCVILDLSFNLLKNLENKCFATTKYLKLLKINDNYIISLDKHCFHYLTKLRYLSLMNNPLIQLHSLFLMHTSHLMLFSVDSVGSLNIYPKAFDGSKINLIITTDYHVCCIAETNTVCTAFKPWFISCSDILPTFGMKLFYRIVSVTIFILNILSIVLQIKSYQSNKCFSLIVISINCNDLLCGIYLSCVWIADLFFSELFKIKEESWRSGILCLTAFTTVLSFTVLTEILLILFSLSRLMVVIYPLKTRFKETSFIVKLLVFLIFFSLFFIVLIVLIFRSSNDFP